MKQKKAKTWHKHKTTVKIANALHELVLEHGAPNTFFWWELKLTGWVDGISRQKANAAGRRMMERLKGCPTCGAGRDEVRFNTGAFGHVKLLYKSGTWRAVQVRPEYCRSSNAQDGMRSPGWAQEETRQR